MSKPSEILRNLLLNGDFQLCYKHICNAKTTISSEIALDLIISCCSYCTTVDPKISLTGSVEEGLTAVLNVCASLIVKPSDNEITNYILCIFHITKFLFTKKSYETVLELQDSLLPPFLLAHMIPEHKSTYKSTCMLIYHQTISQFRTLASTKRSERLVKFSELLLAMHKKLQDPSIALDMMYNCILEMIHERTPPEKILNFYIKIIKDECISDSEQFIQIAPVRIRMYQSVYLVLLKNKEFSLATTCSLSTLENLRQLPLAFKQVLENCHNLNPDCHTMKFHIPNFRNCDKSEYEKIIQTVCILYSTTIFVVQNCTKKSATFLEELPIENLSAFLTFTEKMVQIMSKFKLSNKSTCCEDCRKECGTVEACSILDSLCGLCGTSVGQFEKYPGLSSRIYKYLEKCLEFTEVAGSKKCQKRQQIWNNAYHNLYHIGSDLWKAGHKDWLLFIKKFCLCYFRNEDLKSLKVVKKYLTNCLAMLADHYATEKQLKTSLLFRALSLVVDENINTDVIRTDICKWIKAKVSNRDDSDLQETTLVSILEQSKNIIEEFWPNFFRDVLSREVKVKLLSTELKFYKNFWKSKMSMMSTFREISILLEPIQAGELFVEIWGSGEMQVHTQTVKLLESTIRKIEASQVSENEEKYYFILTCLHFLLHRYKMIMHVANHVEEMEKTIGNIQETQYDGLPEDAPDPDDECDVISTYRNLRISIYVKSIRSLDTSFHYLSTKVMKIAVFSTIDLNKLFTLLSKIAHEYALHDQLLNSLKSWEFALRIAQLMENNQYVLQACSFLIEFSDVTKEYAEKFVYLGDVAAETSENKTDLITYYVCKAHAFIYVDFNKAWESFEKAKQLLDTVWDDSKLKKVSLLRARIHYLHHKFNTLPCQFNVERHRDFTNVSLHLAHRDFIKHYQPEISETAYAMRFFFQINTSLTKMYHEMRMPRELRCYSKEILFTAQKLLLPFQVSLCLFYLAHADIISCNFDDCRVKISGLSDILGLSTELTLHKHAAIPQKEDFEEVVENLGDYLQEMVLDVPTNRVGRQFNSGSPVFQQERFKIPAVLKHNDGCECYYCNSLQFQDYVMKKFYLQGLLSVYEKNQTVANEFLVGTLKIYEYLTKIKYPLYLDRVKANSSEHFIPDGTFTEVYSLTLLQYANLQLFNGNIESSKNMNQKLVLLLKSHKLRQMYLYNETLAQSMDILYQNVRTAKATTETDKNYLDVAFVANKEEAKTPENRYNKVNVVISPSSSSVGRPRPIRRIKFEIPEDDDSDVPNLSQLKHKKKTNNIAKKPIALNTQQPPLPSTSSRTETSAQIKLDLANKNKLLLEKLKKTAKTTGTSAKSVPAASSSKPSRTKNKVQDKLSIIVTAASDDESTITKKKPIVERNLRSRGDRAKNLNTETLIPLKSKKSQNVRK